MRSVPVLLVLSVCLGQGCSTASSDPAAPSTDDVPAACASIEVQRFRELLIVDEGVVGDPRSSNAKAGPWSFAGLVTKMTPEGMTPSGFLTAWLDSWTHENTVNSFRVEARPFVERRLTCPWLRRTPSNRCDETCANCTAHELDLAQAPFRLLAVANRIDLRETEASDGIGEGRFVFGMFDGVADDPNAAPMAGAIIFEFRLPSNDGRNSKFWADRWHALGGIPTFDDHFRDELQKITDDFSGNARITLNQVRVNEREFEWQWDMREYVLAPNGLTITRTKNSPDSTVYGSQGLIDWINANQSSIMRGTHDLPPSFAGGQSQPLFPLALPTLPPDLRKQFAGQTCAGCHQLENPSLDFNFHISPFRKGEAKVSAFLHAPGGVDELSKRTQSLRRALCGR